MTRKQHLEWAKQRALEYCDQGQTLDAFKSFMSDMSKHDETRNHIALKLMTELMANGNLNTPEKMREQIAGFN